MQTVADIPTCRHTHIHTHIYTRTHIPTYTHMHTYTRIHAYAHVHTHVHTCWFDMFLYRHVLSLSLSLSCTTRLDDSRYGSCHECNLERPAQPFGTMILSRACLDQDRRWFPNQAIDRFWAVSQSGDCFLVCAHSNTVTR